jgi:predicted PurR-regulated permease PerM
MGATLGGESGAPVAIGAVARGLGLAVAQLAFALVMGFYWLTSRDEILGFVHRLTPLRHRNRVADVWNDVERTLAAWLRGLAVVAAVVGVASYLGLTAIGVPYALPLAMVAAIGEAIPLVGPIVGAIAALLVAGRLMGSEALLLVAGLYLVIQQVEGSVLVPRVMQRSVGLHPLVVIAALISGASLNGVEGALLAVPVAGALQVVARHLVFDPAIHDHEPQRVGEGVVVFNRDEDEDRDERNAVTSAAGGGNGG